MNRHRISLGASLLLSTVLAAGCDPGSGSPDSRSGGVGDDQDPDDDEPGIGGGFDPDPSCDYACVEVNDEEQVCTQVCPDGCVMIELNRVTEDASGVSGISTGSELCPDDLPDPELGEMTCVLMYEDTGGGPGDCKTDFSDETCELALETCLDGI